MAQGTAPLTDVWRNNILCRIRAGGNFARATFTRADVSTCATRWLNDGTLGTVAANVLRTSWVDLDGDGIRETPGIALEGTRTNVVLWNRDLTNAAWTKTTMTAAKDQTGLDGVTNSASSLLATAGNATCLQAIVLGSSQRAQHAWVKRLVGSGTINMTMDNGATWTVITVTSTTTWTKVTIPSQTLANPTVGFRIVTNADKIAVDYVQNENGAFESQPIPTTTVAVTRAADSLTLPFNFGLQDMTVLARVARPVHADAAGDIGIPPGICDIGNNAILFNRLYFVQAARQLQSDVQTSGTNSFGNRNVPAGATITMAGQWKNFATGGQTALDVGAGFSAFGSVATIQAGYGSQTLRVGGVQGAGSSQLYGVLLDLMVCRGLLSLQRMTQLAGRD